MAEYPSSNNIDPKWVEENNNRIGLRLEIDDCLRRMNTTNLKLVLAYAEELVNR